MKKFTRMAALLMSAMMFAFTSCGESSGDKNEDEVGSAPVATVAIMTIPEVFDCVEGSMKVEFKPSGKSQTLNLTDATGKLDQDLLRIAKTTNNLFDFSVFETVAGCVKCDLTGALNDTSVVIIRNFKVKDGLDLTDNSEYTCKIIVPYLIIDHKGAKYPGSRMIGGEGVIGSRFKEYVERNNTPITINIK